MNNPTRKPMRKCVPITYAPKADAVFAGTCRQTIRACKDDAGEDRYHEGDTIILFEWLGQPRRSKWGRRLTVTLRGAERIEANCEWLLGEDGMPVFADWSSRAADHVAALDGIDPPTGMELRRVLERYHGPFTERLVAFQVLTW